VHCRMSGCTGPLSHAVDRPIAKSRKLLLKAILVFLFPGGVRRDAACREPSPRLRRPAPRPGLGLRLSGSSLATQYIANSFSSQPIRPRLLHPSCSSPREIGEFRRPARWRGAAARQVPRPESGTYATRRSRPASDRGPTGQLPSVPHHPQLSVAGVHPALVAAPFLPGSRDLPLIRDIILQRPDAAGAAARDRCSPASCARSSSCLRRQCPPLAAALSSKLIPPDGARRGAGRDKCPPAVSASTFPMFSAPSPGSRPRLVPTFRSGFLFSCRPISRPHWRVPRHARFGAGAPRLIPLPLLASIGSSRRGDDLHRWRTRDADDVSRFGAERRLDAAFLPWRPS